MAHGVWPMDCGPCAKSAVRNLQWPEGLELAIVSCCKFLYGRGDLGTTNIRVCPNKQMVLAGSSRNLTGCGVPWRGSGVPWHGCGVPWHGCGVPWHGCGVPWHGRSVPCMLLFGGLWIWNALWALQLPHSNWWLPHCIWPLTHSIWRLPHSICENYKAENAPTYQGIGLQIYY